MEIRDLAKSENPIWNRHLAATLTLASFRGHKDVEAHLFRANTDAGEYEEALQLSIVGPADTEMPQAVLQGATPEAAVRYLLEGFTRREMAELAGWLENNLADQIIRLTIYDLQIPAPLGVGPIGSLPPGPRSGFIRLYEHSAWRSAFLPAAWFDLENADQRLFSLQRK